MTIDCSGTDEVICPYCGYGFSDSYEFFGGYTEDAEIQCYECNKKFNASRETSVDYSSKKMPCKKGHKWKFKLAYIKKTKYERLDGKYQDIPLPKEKWEYVEAYECENCDEGNWKHITEEEFKQKHPDSYERGIR